MMDKSLILNIARGSEFLIEALKLNQSFKVEGKKEYLKQSVLQWYFGMWLFPFVMVC